MPGKPLVQPLETAENELLEVLLTRFELARQGRGVGLRLEFDEQTPTIWLRRAKSHLRKSIADFERKSRTYQQELDAFLIRQTGDSYRFDDPDFPFRYVSGGTLPVVRMGGADYTGGGGNGERLDAVERSRIGWRRCRRARMQATTRQRSQPRTTHSVESS